jgi:hypothetical protein
MTIQIPSTSLGLAGHGAGQLTAVHIDTYNAELRDGDGFIGDRASGRAFRAILKDGRERVQQADGDPIGGIASTDISKKKLVRLIVDGDRLAAGVLLGTIEDFAQEFAAVTRRIMRLKDLLGA